MNNLFFILVFILSQYLATTIITCDSRDRVKRNNV